jgi:Tol biopolymer transport system component
MIGTTLAHYAIRQKIGAGGMGEVYLAEDLTLNRHVALKVLPTELASGERRARFALEAKTLAALDHPNIVTVHSIEEDRGIHFITMEFVKGKTLATLAARKGLPLERFFDIAIPLADAVAAAHSKGIVHRDLKPGNVMVSDERRVKVLDFGLAKLAASASPGITSITQTGAIIGTCKYMSPEQARGEEVDARSDIFSLGLMFYEMLTGRPAFGGDTTADVLSSILREEPPGVSAIRSGVPRELSRLVRRCLAKDPAHRVQSALDVRNELEELRREIESGELAAHDGVTGTKRTRLKQAVLAIAIVAGAVVVGLGTWLVTRAAQIRALPIRNTLQVTSAAGVETQVTWSPDGGRLAYVSDETGNQDIWITQAVGGAAVNLTGDYRGADDDPAWSPHGTHIAFRSAREDSGIFLIPSIGGTPLRIASRGSSEAIGSPAWSSDGQQLAFVRREDAGGVIEIVSLRTRESRRLNIPGESGNRFDLAWSPDGRFFAFVRAAGRDMGASTMWVLRAADGQAVALTDGTYDDWSPTWSANSRALFYVSNRSGSMDLWRQRLSADGIPAGEPVAVTAGVGMQQAAFSPDGRKLAFSKGRRVSNVYRVPLLDGREATWQDAEQVTFDQAHVSAFDLFPDGERLVISSDRGGNLDLWQISLRDKEITQLTNDPQPDWAPRVSPDRQRIAFYSDRSGHRDVWVMPSAGGPAVQLTSDEAQDLRPSWSPDGGQVAFHSTSPEATSSLFVVPSAGGAVRQLINSLEAAYTPQWSPDGTWISYVSRERLWRMPASGDAGQKLSDRPCVAVSYRWARDGFIYCVDGEGDRRDIWALSPASGAERNVTRLTGRSGRLGGDLAVGESHLYFSWRADLGDIWVADVVGEQNDY